MHVRQVVHARTRDHSTKGDLCGNNAVELIRKLRLLLTICCILRPIYRFQLVPGRDGIPSQEFPNRADVAATHRASRVNRIQVDWNSHVNSQDYPQTDARRSPSTVDITVNGQKMVARFNIKDIRGARTTDPEIYGNDVIVMGNNSGRQLFKDLISVAPVLGIFYQITR